MRTGRPRLLSEANIQKIREKSYMGMIDKQWIIDEFGVSRETARRTLRKLDLMHSSETIIQVIKEYNSGVTTKDLSEKYNMSTNNIVNLLKHRGIERRRTHYFANFRFFEKIDTEEKAYWLGFIYADGNLYKNSLKITISVKDISLLEKFKHDIESNHEIKITKRSNINENWNDACTILITNKHLREDLIKQGCMENKTFKLKFPTKEQVPKHLIHHFIRGYFDGDGSMSYYTAYTRGYKSTKYHVSFVGTEEFLLECQRVFLENNIKSNEKLRKRHKDRDTNIRDIAITGVKNCKDFFNYIYKDATVYLNRKYEKFKIVN